MRILLKEGSRLRHFAVGDGKRRALGQASPQLKAEPQLG
jgi:hypothetical protein